ncbi:MAG TPA: type II toxin-antitoxin system PemK/MazF family toxin [Planctomycetota bacterium]|nr:type II toxin-antitoxin system PemK/MazF family toxin [Planctomycetota bacterium]
MNNAKRGEIWMVNFDPQIGDKIRKERPAVVLNLPVEQVFQLRLVAPFTEWQPSFAGRITKVQVVPSPQNGLSKTSAADLLQIRSVSTARFRRKVGDLEAQTLAIIVNCIAAFIDAV